MRASRTTGDVVFDSLRMRTREGFLTIDPFHLTVSLGVMALDEVHRDPQLFDDPRPNAGCELGPMITDNIFWDAEVSADMLREQLCCLEGCEEPWT